MPARRLAMLAICGGAFLPFLDTTIVNTSFPDIRASFPDASTSALSWVLDGYFIVIAALLVTAGGLVDRLGRKRVFLGGLLAFVVTSLACAVAPSVGALIAARVLQGIAAAFVAPVSLALLLVVVRPEERAAGVGLWGAAAALAAACGPVLGGVLVEVADWRWIFLINLPLGALVVWAGARGLEESRDESMAGLPDLPGSGLAALGLGLLALGIVEGGDWGWGGARVLGCLTAAAVLLVVVARRCLRHPRPLVDPALMRIASFRSGNLGTLLFAMAFFSAILGNILFLTGPWGYSVLTAGLATVPGPLVAAAVAGPAGRLADRHGHRAVVVPGCIVYALGLLVLRSAGATPDYLGVWLPGMLLLGVGIGLAFPTLGAAAAADIPPERFGSASAVTGAFRQFGAVLGTAILVAIVGEPAGLAEAMAAADRAYVFGVCSALAAGVTALTLVRAPRAVAAAPVPR